MNYSKYRLKIVGKNPKSFLRSLYKLHFRLHAIEDRGDYLIIEVDEEDYRKIKKMKTIYQIEVIGRRGLAKVLYLFRKYFLLLIGLGVGGICLFVLSHLIFSIEVVHTDPKIRQLVLDDLREEGIERLSWKVDFSRQEKIVKRILEKEKDQIEWMEIENIGTSYIVKVEEREMTPTKEPKEPQDIVAAKDGIVMEITATSGTVLKKKNDFVKKGDVLITGVIKNQDTLMKVVPAEGTIFAETWYRSTVEMPLYYKESFLTGRKKTVLQLSFLNQRCNLFDFTPFKNAKEQNTNLIHHALLPLKLDRSVQQEQRIIEEIYTREEAVIKALELSSQKLEKHLGVNDEIISQKTLKITEKERTIIVEVFFKVKEDITATQSIDIEKLEKPKEQ